MILTMEQMKWLKKADNKNGQFHFIGQERATKAERDELKETDNSFLEIYGYHMIDNYQEL